MERIKQLRMCLHLSQSEFAEKYHISVRTLQQWEQGKSEPMESLIRLIEKDIERSLKFSSQYIHTPKNFKICIDEYYKNCEKVYPIQQKKVAKIISDLSADENVYKIVIFGSSVTERCHIGSDVDVYFESCSEKSKLHNEYDFEYDIWSNFAVDERLKKEIEKKGVVVYERNQKSS